MPTAHFMSAPHLTNMSTLDCFEFSLVITISPSTVIITCLFNVSSIRGCTIQHHILQVSNNFVFIFFTSVEQALITSKRTQNYSTQYLYVISRIASIRDEDSSYRADILLVSSHNHHSMVRPVLSPTLFWMSSSTADDDAIDNATSDSLVS